MFSFLRYNVNYDITPVIKLYDASVDGSHCEEAE